MKKNAGLFVIAAVMTVSFQFAGCKKHDTKPPVENEVCHITQMKFTAGLQDEVGTFVYNSYGNPVSFTITQTSTANPNVIFLYDQYNRLTDCFGPYAKLDPANLPAQISFDFWTRYTYADQNPASLPIADTSRLFGFRTNGVFFNPISATDTGHYTFDSQGRIATYKSSSNPNMSTYNYDAKGNAYGLGATPDDKVNFHRANKVFQLVDKNYNANNLIAATTYNSSGFPTAFPTIAFPAVNANFLHRSVNIATIDYSCSMQKSAAE